MREGMGGGDGRVARAPVWGAWFRRAHMALYRATGGLIGHRLGAQRTLLLTTVGRKSGLERTQPLTYFDLEGALVLVASNWGSDYPPAWYLNLEARPRAWAQVRGDVFEVMARVADVEERAQLWPRVVARNQQYARYQEVTSREIPMVLLLRLPAP